MRTSPLAARSVITALVVLAAWAAPTSAHDLWIDPVEAASADTVVPIDVLLGHSDQHVETLPRNSGRIVRLVAHGPDAEAVDLPGLDGARPYGVVRPEAAGSWVVGYESRPFVHRLGAERFHHHLEIEGLDEVAAARRRDGTDGTPGIEWVSRSVKTVFSVDGATLVDRRIGLPLEIVAESLPTAGSTDLVLRVEVEGTARAGVLVDLRRLNETPSAGDRRAPEVLEPRRTDADGRVRFAIGSGSWMAAATISRPLTGGEEGADRADWRTIFASWTAVLR